MGDRFGASSAKPTEWWGTAPWLLSLTRVPKTLRERDFVRLASTKDGKVTGNRPLLRKSQVYPPEFGRRMAQLHHNFLSSFTLLGLWGLRSLPVAIKLRVLAHVHGTIAAPKAISKI